MSDVIAELKQDEVSFAAYDFARNRHNTPKAAKKYSTRYADNYKDAKEKACILAALEGLPKNSKVLDLPCGTGRMSYLIRDKGFNVVAADYALPMLEEAKNKVEESGETNIVFEQQDIFNLTYADATFDAVICNRLFHHFTTAHLREAALKELKRVSKGKNIIVSFYSINTLSALVRALKHNFKASDFYHAYISLKQFDKEIKRCGLKIVSQYYVRKSISAQMYVKLSVI